MNDVISIDQLKKKATTVIEIPDIDGTGTIKIRVQKPRLMALAAQGKIPNPLMGVATKLIRNEFKDKDIDLSNTAKMVELYCRACMVEPSYEEMKDIITDDQMLAVFNWAIGGVESLNNFRTNEGNGPSNNNGQAV